MPSKAIRCLDHPRRARWPRWVDKTRGACWIGGRQKSGGRNSGNGDGFGVDPISIVCTAFPNAPGTGVPLIFDLSSSTSFCAGAV